MLTPDDDASNSNTTEPDPEIVSIDAILDDSAQGVSELSGEDTIVFPRAIPMIMS